MIIVNNIQIFKTKKILGNNPQFEKQHFLKQEVSTWTLKPTEKIYKLKKLEGGGMVGVRFSIPTQKSVRASRNYHISHFENLEDIKDDVTIATLIALFIWRQMVISGMNSNWRQQQKTSKKLSFMYLKSAVRSLVQQGNLVGIRDPKIFPPSKTSRGLAHAQKCNQRSKAL